ncbi:hypothetical protein [Hyella patelloides]|nr:hypothetical protein [Hyella patelloides]
MKNSTFIRSYRVTKIGKSRELIDYQPPSPPILREKSLKSPFLGDLGE